MSKEKQKQRNQFIFFYIIIVYVFSFLFWWSYLLYKKTNLHFVESSKVAMNEHIQSGQDIATFNSSENFLILEKDFIREKRMIVTEGIVFFLILAFGMYRIRRSFLQEVEIANQQRNFILSITHELKSPLSSIKLMSETLLKRDLDRPTQEKLLRNSIDESNRLESLVENILLAAKIESEQYGFTREPMDLSEVVTRTVSRMSMSKNVTIKSNIEEGVQINGDRSALVSIVSNLIGNAIKYAPESEFFEVELAKKKNKIYLEVKDYGNGIEPSERLKIFDKFYRIGNEDTRKAKGTGLGLYIVEELVLYHNGEISVVDNDPKGSIFRAIFNV